MKNQMNISSTTRNKKYFSLIDKSLFPSLMSKTQQKDSTKATISLLKKNKFIFLDMNATNGFKAMEMNPEPQSDQQDQVYGQYVVCEGVKTSREKVKLKEFMTINHKTREKHNLMRSRVKEQLDKSKEKFATLNNSPRNSKPLLKLHRGLDIQKYNQIKNTLQTQQINAQILKKESKMMQKLGIVADFQSIKEKNTPSYVEKSKKTESYFLPRILKGF